MNRKPQQIVLLIIAITVLSVLAGCYPPDLSGSVPPDGVPGGETPGATPGPATPALPPLAWRPINIGGAPVPSDSTAYIKFGPGNAVSGSGGCNSFGGTYEVNGASLRFGSLASTEMFCEGRMEVERAFLDALTATAGYEWLGDSFVLKDASGAIVASFAPRSESGLRDTGWVATGINNGKDAVVSVTGNVTAIFGADGRVGGNAGCNSYGADYNVDGDKLTIGQAVSTLMACADQAMMDQEQAFLKALPQVATYSINGDVLELRDASGALLVSFRAAKG